MRAKTGKILAWTVSLLLHVALVYFLASDFKSADSRWQGGGSAGEAGFVMVTLEPIAVGGSPGQESVAETGLTKSDRSDQSDRSDRSDKSDKAIKRNSSTPQGNPTAGSPGPAGPGLDTTGPASPQAPNVLAQIRKRIYSKKVYPLAAQDNGITGSVKLSFRINLDGTLAGVSVLSGSGHKILDDAALKAIRKAAPFPYYPQTIALTLEYKLDEGH